MNVRRPKAHGATLMAQMYPHPQCHSARLQKLGYVPPVWHRALRRAPPKDLYPLKRITKSTELPGDKIVKKVMRKIPMLTKERYEYFNPDYKPLATRIALTQMRIQREQGLNEETAFQKCEQDIFKEELYYFAKGIRDNPGNHFRLTQDEMRSFYIHDLINEAQYLKKRVVEAVEGMDTTAAVQADPSSPVQAEVASRIAQDSLAQYLIEPVEIIDEVQKRRRFKPVPVNNLHEPYKITGEWTAQPDTLFSHPVYRVDDAIMMRHKGILQETQRYLNSQVQVPASAFIDGIEFGDDNIEVPDVDFSNDGMFHPDILVAGTHFISQNAPTHFSAHEGLTFRQLSLEENEIDKQIAIMLLKKDKKVQKYADRQVAAEKAAQQAAAQADVKH
jgi:hypothetical protein